MPRTRLVLPFFLALLLMVLSACGGTAEAPQPQPTLATEPTEATEAPTEATEATEAPTEATEAPTEATETSQGSTTGAPVEDPASLKVGLITDVGRVNDGTFNQFAHQGVLQAQEEAGFEYSFIETQAQADYNANIQTMVGDEFDVIVTVGFLIEDATFESAQEHPEIVFIGVDQFFGEDRALPNLVGLQFREDQAGFLAGALAGMMTNSNTVGIVAGVEIPPVKKYFNGYENGVNYVNPEANVLGVYEASFTDPVKGASTAGQFIGEGADVIFGAGGPTGSGAIKAAAEQGAYVIGVDQDEYLTTFGNGESPGADRLLSSAIKRVDVAVYDQITAVINGTFTGNGIAIYEAANDGIGLADFHDTAEVVPEAVKTRLDEILTMLADGTLMTGVDPVSGDLDEATIPEPVPFVPE